MDFYTIPPNKHLDLMHEGNRYFALAHHYFSDTEYRKYFLNLRKGNSQAFITLDNGAAEHSLVTETMLLEAVSELKPNEVIAPDILFNKKQTIINLYNFIEKMIEHGFIKHTNVFGCPQGSNKQEWLECYYIMMINPMVSVIGLSKIAVPKCWHNVVGDQKIAVSRNQCIQELYEKQWLRKPIHLLGMGEHTEFDYYNEHKIPNIRSSDSCYTVLAALNDISFKDGITTRVPTTNEYFNQTLTSEQIILAKNNVEYLKEKYKQI